MVGVGLGLDQIKGSTPRSGSTLLCNPKKRIRKRNQNGKIADNIGTYLILVIMYLVNLQHTQAFPLITIDNLFQPSRQYSVLFETLLLIRDDESQQQSCIQYNNATAHCTNSGILMLKYNSGNVQIQETSTLTLDQISKIMYVKSAWRTWMVQLLTSAPNHTHTHTHVCVCYKVLGREVGQSQNIYIDHYLLWKTSINIKRH